jgi:latrophilin 1
VQDVVSNLLDDNQLESWLELSNKEQRLAITSMMHTLERMALLLADTKTGTSDYIRAHHNIFISIHVRSVSTLNNGLHLPPFAEPLDESMPESVTSITNSVYLGQQSLIEQSTPSGLTKVVFLMYKKLAQFLKPDIETMGHYPIVMTSDGDMTQLNITRIINSDIIGVLLNCERYTPLSEPIEFTLKHVNTKNVTNAKCVFWDIERREWSQQGCETLWTNETHTNCKCNHLTNFAILMDINDTPLSRSNELALRVITFVGCTISIICLAFTFVTLISFRCVCL